MGMHGNTLEPRWHMKRAPCRELRVQPKACVDAGSAT
jgi:hypothetical protein